MESNEKIFKYSFSFELVARTLGALVYLFISGMIVFHSETILWQRFFWGAIFLIFLFYLLYETLNFTSYLRISNEKIIVRKLFSEKSLEWNEIARASASGTSLLLHNHDNTIKLIVSSKLREYSEILEFIFKKRFDLFKKDEKILTRGRWHGLFVLANIAMFSVGIIFLSDFISRMLLCLMIVLAVFFWLRSPQSIVLETDSLTVTYLFREVNCPARWIDSITLENRWGGENYFVQIALRTGKSIDLSTFLHGGILNYPSIKRWYKKAAANQSPISF